MPSRSRSRTAKEVVERHQEIVRLRARGLSNSQVARRLDVDPTTVSREWKEWTAQNPTLRHADPMEIVDGVLMGYQQDLEDLAEVAESAKNPTAVVGAINARMAARDRIVALLQATGVLPHDLGKLRVEMDVRYIAQQFVQILNRHEVPELVQRELLEALRGPAAQIEN